MGAWIGALPVSGFLPARLGGERIPDWPAWAACSLFAGPLMQRSGASEPRCHSIANETNETPQPHHEIHKSFAPLF
jgi:hypothetical protein